MRFTDFFKATAKGGLLFMVPIGFLAIVLGKVYELVLVVAEPLGAWLPLDTVGGVAIANFLAILILLAICFIAGILANFSNARALVERMETGVLSKFPGYIFGKSMAESFISAESAMERMLPVIANFDDNAQIAFEMSRQEDGTVILYLPGAPNPWSGSIIYMEPARVHRLDMKTHEVIQQIRGLGVNVPDTPGDAFTPKGMEAPPAKS